MHLGPGRRGGFGPSDSEATPISSLISDHRWLARPGDSCAVFTCTIDAYRHTYKRTLGAMLACQSGLSGGGTLIEPPLRGRWRSSFNHSLKLGVPTCTTLSSSHPCILISNPFSSSTDQYQRPPTAPTFPRSTPSPHRPVDNSNQHGQPRYPGQAPARVPRAHHHRRAEDWRGELADTVWPA